MDKTKLSKSFKAAFHTALPIIAGYLVLGGGFGILLSASGYGVIWAVLMSVFIYAGSMQYVAVGLLSGGATLIHSAVMTIMVQARHIFYGISMVDKYSDTGKIKPYLAFALTDETYSVVCSGKVPEETDKHMYWLFLSMINQCAWIMGCSLGNVFGTILDFNSAGVEFSMTALFVVIFTEQWREGKNRKGALLGIGASVICLLIFGPDNFIIPAMVIIAAVLCTAGKLKENKK